MLYSLSYVAVPEGCCQRQESNLRPPDQQEEIPSFASGLAMYLCSNDPFPGPAPNAWRETECRTRGLSKDGPSLRTEVDELLMLYLTELQPRFLSRLG